jgi:hypothetical protein
MMPPARVTLPSRASLGQGTLVVALLVAMGFLGFMLAATGGHVVPQVVDLYLVCQYARALAEGHPFQYNAGEAFSTGATSLLHTVILAAAHRVGIRGEGLIAFAIACGIAAFLATTVLARRIAALVGGPREAVLAGALVALSGPVAWGFLYGSDVALFMLLAAWTCERFLAGWPAGSAGGFAAAGSLLSLSRPEGLPLGMLLGAVWVAGPGRSVRGPWRLLPLLPAATGLVVLVLYWRLTGSWVGTSVADKSLLANYGAAEGLGLMADYGTDVIRGLLLGFYDSRAPVGFGRGWSSLYFPPLGLLLVLLAVVQAPAARRPPLAWWLAGVAALFGLLSANVFQGVHFHRYLVWALPVLLALVAAGLGGLTRLLARDDPRLERGLFRAVALLFLLLGALSTLRFATIYGGLAGEVWRRDVAAARWIGEHLPAGASVANLATSVEYLTGHRNLNLHGVTSPAFFGNHAAEREAGTWEALSRLAPAALPEYLMSTVSAQAAYPTMQELEGGPPLFQTNSLSDEIVIFRLRPDLLGRQGTFYLPASRQATQGLSETDRLNVCDARDEESHRYRFRSRLGDLHLRGTARIASYETGGAEVKVADGGRAILGEETFEVRTIPGRDLVVVSRTASSVAATILRAESARQFSIEIPRATVAVEVDGSPPLERTMSPGPGWDEAVLRIAGALVTKERTALRLKGRYASFHYWFYQ